MLFTAGTVAVSSAAQDDQNANNEDNTESTPDVEEIVTIGTRVQDDSRTVADSVVPVDLYSNEQIQGVNSSDLIEVLATLIPSFAVRRQPISDGASFVRPTHMRSMETHHSLVLLSNKRRHRSAFMLLGGYGSHGADIGSVPSIAIDTVEVLRDGAAAQYGTDAIAGVMNFRLRSEDSGGEARYRVGQYGEGDGLERTIEGNWGIPFVDLGFLNLSFQYSDVAGTSRSQHYDIAIPGTSMLPHLAVTNQMTVNGTTYYGPDAFTYTYSGSGEPLQVLRAPDGIPDDLDQRFADNFDRIGADRRFNEHAQVWGQPEREQAQFVLNSEINVSDSLDLYGYGTYSRKDQSGGFFYRRPGIVTFYPVRLRDGSIYSARRDLYPAGFTPQFSAVVLDTSLHGGLRRHLRDGWFLDFALGYGNSEIQYTLRNTLNPSLGPDTPTEFRPGDLINTELALNFDASRDVDLGMERPIHIATGIEWRRETYEIKQGDPASYETGPFAVKDPFNFEITQSEVDAYADDAFTVVACRIPGFEVVGSLCPDGDPINNTLPIGSNGFPGYSPKYAINEDQETFSIYGDLEYDLTDSWLVNAAARYERFEGFGDVLIWKLASRVRVTENVNLRGSLGTGFRAPTTGQLATTNVATRINADGVPVAVGTFPATHAAARLFGSVPLKPEDSTSYTLGMTFDLFNAINVAIDLYNIELENRIILSSRFSVTPEQRANLIDLNVPNAADIGAVSFFTNDVDTRTSGLDVVLSWPIDWDLGLSTVQGSLNLNKTEISKRGRYVNDEGEFDIENGVPNDRATVSVNHSWRNIEAFARLRYYGEYKNASNASLTNIQVFPAEIMVDLGSTFTFSQRYSLRVGIENVLDNYPDPADFEACCGRIYRSDSAVPWQGALYYGQFSVEF